MALIRINQVIVLEGHRLHLTLSDGRVLERDVSDLLSGPVFASIRDQPSLFRQVRVEHGTLVWPGGIDLCPDVLIWNGAPPTDSVTAATQAK